LLAEASNSQGNFLFATDFHNNKIDVFDKNFDKVTLGQNGWGTFTDPNEPAGYAPFGIKEVTIGGKNVILVSYAKQDVPGAGHDDAAGPGNGLIDEFDTSGHFLGRFATGSAVGGTAPLDSPIGMTIAPAGFGPDGKFGGALLVGNFGDSHVSAFDLKTGKFLGQLSDAQGNPLTLNGGVGSSSGSKGLWGIAFGNGKGGTDPNALYFAAGINDENDGLFGKVTMSDGGHGHDSALAPTVLGNAGQQPAIANLMSNNPAATMSAPMQMASGMAQPASGMMPSQIDAIFANFDSMLLSLESMLLARMPQLDGMIQAFNAEVAMVESAVAGHPINDLSGKL
jgi:hypothetical protein